MNLPLIDSTSRPPYRPGRWGWVLCLLACWPGCSRQVALTSISPSAAAQAAMAQYDTNKDGSLDAAELEKCPALKSALKAIDKDGNGRVSEQELTDRLAILYRESGAGLTSVKCWVLFDNGPLEGATVTLEPEKFLGPAIKSASGVSDPAGMVTLQMEGEKEQGVMQYGYFKARVSKKNGQGQETIPAKYNENTTLGAEVAPDGRGGDGIRLQLTSR